MMLSPPGRLSITTGLPQRADSFSWIRRAPMSAPAPGPNGMTNFTGRCGQAGAWACAGRAGIPERATTRAAARRFHELIVVPRNATERPQNASQSPGRAQRSLRGLLVAGLVDRRDPVALRRNRRRKFLRRTSARRGPHAGHAGAERGVGDD